MKHASQLSGVQSQRRDKKELSFKTVSLVYSKVRH